MIKIRIHGEQVELPAPCPFPEALAHLGQELPARAAVALNGRVVPRDSLPTLKLQDGDELLLIRPTFGG